MRFFTAVFASLALLAVPSFGAPTAALKTVETYAGQVKEQSYVVVLKNGVSKNAHLNWVHEHVGNNTVTHAEWRADLLNGFAGKFTQSQLNQLRANPDIESIVEDGIFSINAAVTQTNAPWGIARLSQDARLSNQNTGSLTFTYKYDSAAGAGVDVYVVDTGIFTSHSQFGGRARWGATFGGYANADGNGHGTHVAGTVGSNQYGVAKSVSLIAVKVLSDQGSGSVSDIVSGLNWVLTQARASGRPSIATLSLGGSASTPLDNAIVSLVNAGIHVTVAAGNDNVDARNTSPARVAVANTIGASTIADARASFSNFGSVVDLFAPGQNIISTWIGSTTATNNISGTSMATPHVAGLIAYLISVEGNSSPAAISDRLKSLAVKGVLSGIPSGTVNNLARNDQ
ncbi:serine protease [Panus rudis PR-1116 ss-1]|nr:serine protease [Panus rudis PR-1116 ss-1]